MIIERYAGNPVLEPNKSQSWEAQAVFNGCPVEKDGKVYLVYRAVSLPHYHTSAKTKLMVSEVGVAVGNDGLSFGDRKRFIVPEEEWEMFGCEDPRVTYIDGKYFVFYTAISNWPPNQDGIKVGVAISRDLETIEERHLVTPFNAKAMAMFSEKVGGKYWAVLSVNTDKPPADIALVSFDSEEQVWSSDHWKAWYEKRKEFTLPLVRSEHDHVEVGAPPLKTKYGWLLFYSYIKNYFVGKPVFSVEAVLLDLEDPRKIIGRTDLPLLSPEEYYEQYGLVPRVVFPSGALLREEDKVWLYYGAADTTCAVVFIELPTLIKNIKKQTVQVRLSRYEGNPILSPVESSDWENKAVFNPAAILLDGKVHLMYRAMGGDNTSSFGYATSSDGVKIEYRSDRPVYVPREMYEQKLQPGGNSGVEDPRLIEMEGRIYMFYTAFNGKSPPRVALTWITRENFVANKWEWSEPMLISPPDLDDKDAAMFPEKVDGKYVIIHRNGDDMDLSYKDSLKFGDGEWLEEYRWIMPRPGWWDSKKVGLSGPPIKTEDGWLVMYHGVSDDGIYRVGAVLTEVNDPTEIINRTDRPIFEPEAVYEKIGVVPNVVFPCGTVVLGDKLYVYYGGGDKVIGVAKVVLDDLVKGLKNGLI